MFMLFLKVGSIEHQGVMGVTLVDTFYFSSPCRWRRGRYKRRHHVQLPNHHITPGMGGPATQCSPRVPIEHFLRVLYICVCYFWDAACIVTPRMRKSFWARLTVIVHFWISFCPKICCQVARGLVINLFFPLWLANQWELWPCPILLKTSSALMYHRQNSNPENETQNCHWTNPTAVGPVSASICSAF